MQPLPGMFWWSSWLTSRSIITVRAFLIVSFVGRLFLSIQSSVSLAILLNVSTIAWTEGTQLPVVNIPVIILPVTVACYSRLWRRRGARCGYNRRKSYSVTIPAWCRSGCCCSGFRGGRSRVAVPRWPKSAC